MSESTPKQFRIEFVIMSVDNRFWYYTAGGQKGGPVSDAELKRLTDIGSIRSDDLVWTDGCADWIPAGKVRVLLQAARRGGLPSLPQVDSSAKGGSVAERIPGPKTFTGEQFRPSVAGNEEAFGTNNVNRADQNRSSGWLEGIGVFLINGLLLLWLIYIGFTFCVSYFSPVLKPDGRVPTNEQLREHIEKHGPIPVRNPTDGHYQEVTEYWRTMGRKTKFRSMSKVVMIEEGWEVHVRYDVIVGERKPKRIAFNAFLKIRNGKVVAERELE